MKAGDSVPLKSHYKDKGKEKRIREITKEVAERNKVRVSVAGITFSAQLKEKGN